MTSQQPTRFENYPLEPDPGARLLADPVVWPAPVSPTAPAPVRPAAGRDVSRRAVIATAIGITLAGAGALTLFAADPGHREVTVGETAEMGDYSAAVAENWTVMSEDGTQLVLGNGSNRLYAWNDHFPPGTRAVDALEPMVKRAVPDIDGLKASIGTPVDASDSDVQRASLAGSGTLGRRSAQIIANIWIDPVGRYLFTIRILTDKVNSDAAYGAQQMIDQLSEDF